MHYSDKIVSKLFIRAEFTNNALINIIGSESPSDYFISWAWAKCPYWVIWKPAQSKAVSDCRTIGTALHNSSGKASVSLLITRHLLLQGIRMKQVWDKAAWGISSQRLIQYASPLYLPFGRKIFQTKVCSEKLAYQLRLARLWRALTKIDNLTQL